ncbi:MAG: 30S ribosomal protein S6 [Candidatus Binatia bacterium]
MRPYETMFVLSTRLGEELPALRNRLVSVVETQGGTIDGNHDWGVRKLAYPIEDQQHGHYFLLEYTAGPEVVSELERNMRITEGILRFISVQQDHTGLPRTREEPPPTGEATPLHKMGSVEARDTGGETESGAGPERAVSEESATDAAETGVGEKGPDAGGTVAKNADGETEGDEGK